MRAKIRVLQGVARDSRIVKIQIAFFGFNVAEYATWIAMLVYAYDRGGASATGRAAAIMLIPAGLAAPFGALAGDRFPRQRVLFVSYLVQAAALGLVTVALFFGAPLAVTVVLAAVAVISQRFTRPTQSALMPGLSEDPEALVAANAVSTFCESAGIVIGPLVAGIILGRWGPGYVFATFVVVSLLDALLVSRIDNSNSSEEPWQAQTESRGIVRESLGGFRFLFANRRAAPLVVAMTGGLIVLGALDVLIVAVAISLLGKGPSWAGFLSAASGVGGLIGAAVAVSLVGGRRLIPPLAGGMFVFGGSIAALGVISAPVAAPLLLAVGGVGGSVEWVASETLLQRAVPDEVMTRVFGILEGVGAFAWAIGSICVSSLIVAFGVRVALVVTGLFAPTLVTALWVALSAVERRATAPDPATVDLVRRTSMFALLPPAATEQISADLAPLEVSGGETIIREGDLGDRVYLIVEGFAEVTRRGEHVAELGAGDHFGEIALLRDVARTATVKAKTRMKLMTLARAPFLEVVTGHAQSRQRADTIADQRSE